MGEFNMFESVSNLGSEPLSGLRCPLLRNQDMSPIRAENALGPDPRRIPRSLAMYGISSAGGLPLIINSETLPFR